MSGLSIFISQTARAATRGEAALGAVARLCIPPSGMIPAESEFSLLCGRLMMARCMCPSHADDSLTRGAASLTLLRAEAQPACFAAPEIQPLGAGFSPRSTAARPDHPYHELQHGMQQSWACQGMLSSRSGTWSSSAHCWQPVNQHGCILAGPLASFSRAICCMTGSAGEPQGPAQQPPPSGNQVGSQEQPTGASPGCSGTTTGVRIVKPASGSATSHWPKSVRKPPPGRQC